MIFPTVGKCNRAVDSLVYRIEGIQMRLKRFEEQDKIVGSLFGPTSGLKDTQIQCMEIWATLLESKEGLRRGLFSARLFARSLANIDKIATVYERSLARMEVDNVAGKTVADAYVGTLDASN